MGLSFPDEPIVEIALPKSEVYACLGSLDLVEMSDDDDAF